MYKYYADLCTNKEYILFIGLFELFFFESSKVFDEELTFQESCQRTIFYRTLSLLPI